MLAACVYDTITGSTNKMPSLPSPPPMSHTPPPSDTNTTPILLHAHFFFGVRRGNGKLPAWMRVLWGGGGTDVTLLVVACVFHSISPQSLPPPPPHPTPPRPPWPIALWLLFCLLAFFFVSTHSHLSISCRHTAPRMHPSPLPLPPSFTPSFPRKSSRLSSHHPLQQPPCRGRLWHHPRTQ